jgi:hypothetical protein
MDNIKTYYDIRPRDVYGTTLYYPECKLAKMFVKLAGAKTLTDRTRAELARHDFIAVDVTDPASVAARVCILMNEEN